MQFMLLSQGKIDNLLNQEDFPIESINVDAKDKLSFNSSFSFIFVVPNKVVLIITIMTTMHFHLIKH